MAKILYMTLQSVIGLNPCGSYECYVFGVRARNVEFRVRRIILVHLDSSTNFTMSSPRKDQVTWKNLTVNPSGPGALFLTIFLITSSTFALDFFLNRAKFWSLLIKLGICCMILLILSPLIMFGSVRSTLKYCTNIFSISSFWVSRFPCWSIKEKILFCCLCCIISLWKNLVFLSPSFNHWILDFCFHGTSSCCIFSSNFSINDSSSSTSPSRLPSLIICCYTFFIFVWIFSCSLCTLSNSPLFHFFILPFGSFSLSWKVCI